MHQQAAQRPVAEQTMLASQSSKQTEELRHQNAALEQSPKLDVRTNQEQAGGKGYKRQTRKPTPDTTADETGPEQPVHPYKGHHFDIKL